jgi:hypothetical protein
MAVRSTRSSLNIRQKLSELDRPVGIIGDALMATNNVQDAYDILQCGRRNMIINGDMRIAQRGTSAVGISSSIPYLVDRFCFAVNTGGTWSYTQSSNAPSGFNTSARFEVTSANSSLSSASYVIPQYVFEGNDLQRLAWGTTSAKPLTLSFWCRSNKPGIYHAEFQIQGSKEISKRYTINTPDVWEYKTVTFEPNYQYPITATNAYGGNFYWWLAAGTAYNNPGNTLHSVWGDGTGDRCPGNVNLADTVGNYFEITGVQCEIGNVATPFEYRYYNEELALCQRYYYRLTSPGAGFSFSLSYNDSTTLARGVVEFPVTMRTSPTALEQTGTASDYQIEVPGTANTCTSVPTFASASVYNARVQFTTTGLTAGQGSALRAANATAYLGWSAEL